MAYRVNLDGITMNFDGMKGYKMAMAYRVNLLTSILAAKQY